jgi:transcriptional regulator with XRE-family HTH domain
MAKLRRISTTASRLQEAMDRAQKKQIDLVNETGLNRGTISRYLSGEYDPKNVSIYKLAKALDVDEMWLWGYDVPMERSIRPTEDDAPFDMLYDLIKEDERLKIAIRKYFKLDNVGQAMILAYVDAQYDSRNGEETVEEMLEKCVAPDDAASNQ